MSINKMSTKEPGPVTDLRVMSYNIRSCLGPEPKTDIEKVYAKVTINEICKVIRESGADIIALNEVDCKTFRAQGLDQIAYISEVTGYFGQFGKTMSHYNGYYGNGLISKYRIISARNHVLSTNDGKYMMEPRGMLECQVDVEGSIINVLTVHFGLKLQERTQAVHYISEFLQNIEGTTILMGDFNLDYETEFDEMKPLLENLKDTAIETGKAKELKTFTSLNPIKKIDYILVSKDVEVVNTGIIRSSASDHLPIFADIRIARK